MHRVDGCVVTTGGEEGENTCSRRISRRTSDFHGAFGVPKCICTVSCRNVIYIYHARTLPSCYRWFIMDRATKQLFHFLSFTVVLAWLFTHPIEKPKCHFLPLSSSRHGNRTKTRVYYNQYSCIGLTIHCPTVGVGAGFNVVAGQFSAPRGLGFFQMQQALDFLNDTK